METWERIASASADAGGPRSGHVAQWVAERILDRIAGGDLVPGARLPGERQLAESLKVSRVSIRAGLQTLKTQGFLASVQGGGTRVVSSAGAMDGALVEMARAKVENLYDLIEIRMVLEGWAARRAAERATLEQIGAIAQLAEATRTPGRDHVADDVAFHLAIGDAAGSAVYPHILATIGEALSRMVAFHHSPLFAADPGATIERQHAAIAEAIRARLPDEAEAAMRAHLGWVLTRYREIRAP